MKPHVSIIILNWNAKKFIRDCIGSVMKMNYDNYDVILVDNASSDGSVDYAKKIFAKQISSGKLSVISNPKNLGVPEGNNIGIRAAMEKNPKYLALLNPDTIVDTDWLSNMVTTAENDKEVGAVQGKMLAFDKKTIDSTGIVIYGSLLNAVDRGQGEKDVGQYDEEQEILAACAAGALYRASALKDAALGRDYLDSDFFCYWEDADLSLRMFLRGWKIMYCPRAVMYHGRSVLTGKASPFSTYYLHRNSLWFVAKCIPAKIILKRLGFAITFNIMAFAGIGLMRSRCFPDFLRAKIDSLAGLGKMLRKRREIMKNSRFDARKMEKLIDRRFISSSLSA